MVKPTSFKIVWDRKALDHLKDILTYLEKQSKQAPKIIKNTILSRLNLIKANSSACVLPVKSLCLSAHWNAASLNLRCMPAPKNTQAATQN